MTIIRSQAYNVKLRYGNWRYLNWGRHARHAKWITYYHVPTSSIDQTYIQSLVILIVFIIIIAIINRQLIPPKTTKISPST